jgi:hypothetical protein
MCGERFKYSSQQFPHVYLKEAKLNTVTMASVICGHRNGKRITSFVVQQDSSKLSFVDKSVGLNRSLRLIILDAMKT